MNVLRPVLMAFMGSVSWPVCDCLWLASGPLYDLVESVIA